MCCFQRASHQELPWDAEQRAPRQPHEPRHLNPIHRLHALPSFRSIQGQCPVGYANKRPHRRLRPPVWFRNWVRRRRSRGLPCFQRLPCLRVAPAFPSCSRRSLVAWSSSWRSGSLRESACELQDCAHSSAPHGRRQSQCVPAHVARRRPAPRSLDPQGAFLGESPCRRRSALYPLS